MSTFRITLSGLFALGPYHHKLQRLSWPAISTLAVITALSTGGCGSSAQIEALSPNAVVVAFGDSLTSGKGAAENDHYPAALSALTGYTVINAGLSGEVTASGLERLPSVLKKYQPDLVILCHGGNDMLRKQNRDETVANLSAMIVMIKQAGADVILIGVPEPGIFVNTASFYDDLARSHGIPYEGEIVSQVLGDASLKSDFIHPNAYGYRRIAESVASLLRDSQPA